MASRKNLLRADYDLIEFNIDDSSFKDDMASMEIPIFSLSKNIDTSDWEWSSVDGKKTIHVFPTSKYGRPTMFDKDILLFVISGMVRNLNNGMPVSRKIRFIPYQYFIALGKHPTGANYKMLKNGLLRLSTTSIGTNVKTGNIEINKIFRLIDSLSLYEEDKSIAGVELVISEWLFNSINTRQILTINPEYFLLERPIDKRLYEIAKKHCGNQPEWTIGLENLKEKAGSRSDIYEFTRMLKEVMKADKIPDYRISVNKKKVKFYQKDQYKYSESLVN